MTKPISRPFIDYPVLLTAALSLAGAVVAFRITPTHTVAHVAIALWSITLFSLVLHMFTKTSPRWNSVGLRHSPGRVVANLTILAIVPANAISIMSVWAIATKWTAPEIAAVWMCGSLLINAYATFQLARYMRWI